MALHEDKASLLAELDYRVSVFNARGKWVGSLLAPTEGRAVDDFRCVAFPGYRGELGRWDAAAGDYVTYRVLTTDEEGR